MYQVELEISTSVLYSMYCIYWPPVTLETYLIKWADWMHWVESAHLSFCVLAWEEHSEDHLGTVWRKFHAGFNLDHWLDHMWVFFCVVALLYYNNEHYEVWVIWFFTDWITHWVWRTFIDICLFYSQIYIELILTLLFAQ